MCVPYDPKQSRSRPRRTEGAPAPVDAILDGPADPTPDPTPDPAPTPADPGPGERPDPSGRAERPIRLAELTPPVVTASPEVVPVKGPRWVFVAFLAAVLVVVVVRVRRRRR